MRVCAFLLSIAWSLLLDDEQNAVDQYVPELDCTGRDSYGYPSLRKVNPLLTSYELVVSFYVVSPRRMDYTVKFKTIELIIRLTWKKSILKVRKRSRPSLRLKYS